MKRKGGRGKGSREGYRRLKLWVQEQGAGEGECPGDSGEELLEAVGRNELLRWIPRLFREGSEADRKRILQGLVPAAGPGAIPFLEEVMASPGSRLAEKKIALERFEALGGQGDGAFQENLRKAEDFVASLQASLLDASTPEAVPEDVLSRFRDLPLSFRGVVLRELLRRPPQNAFRFLDRVLEGQEDLWEEILEMLGEAPQEEAGRLLQAGYGTAGKGLRKKIRRVVHKRSARDLPVFPLEQEGPGEAVWKAPAPPAPEGLIGLPDPTGGRMVWVIRPNVRKGMLVFAGWVDDQGRLREFHVIDPSRKEAEQYKESVLGNPELPVVECHAGFCASLLDEGYRTRAHLSAEGVELFKALRPLLQEVVPVERPTAPVYTVLSDTPDEASLGDSVGDSANLLKERLLLAWNFEAERMEPHLDKLEEISESRIIVQPYQKKERMDALYREIAGELLSDPAYRTSWRRRLEDAAWVFYKKGLEAQARSAAHVSRYLEDPEGNAGRIPFFVELVRRGMEGMLKEKKTEEKQAPSLIVKP